MRGVDSGGGGGGAYVGSVWGGKLAGWGLGWVGGCFSLWTVSSMKLGWRGLADVYSCMMLRRP